MPLYFDAGNAIVFFLFLVPMTTLKRIMKKNKFTEQYLSGIPYLMTLLLSAAWYVFLFLGL
ncbi:unnamed protein product [Prunus armeniaca]|uniref:Uncharacterized protein n=1 Tax=Prunus armeniaca TaxID=36596 RepID=A0A6J5Y6B3_PRUAR|nr:unnamed protein product [Prunus armeniaca]